MGQYRNAQICENGHCISFSVDLHPEHAEMFCHICGAKTISKCPSCDVKIRGNYETTGACIVGSVYSTPLYCYLCGKPFPWTVSAIETATAIIREEETMTEIQQNELIDVLPDVMTETPKTKLATVRMKKAISSAGQFTAEALKNFLIDFGCEYIKRQIGL